MRTTYLRLATRHPDTGMRTWAVPGHSKPATLLPAACNPYSDPWAHGPMFWWPTGEGVCKGVTLRLYRGAQRHGLRSLLKALIEGGRPATVELVAA